MSTIKERITMSPVEVISSVQRRRQWTPEEKQAMLEEAEQPGISVSTLCPNSSNRLSSDALAREL